MLNFLIFVFASSLVGILGICYFFLNTELNEKEKREKLRSSGENQKTSAKPLADENSSKSDRTPSKITDCEESHKTLPEENERCLCEKIVRLLKEAEDKDITIKTLQMELKQEKLKSQDQIKEKIDEVISNFEPKLLQLFSRSGEKLDRLLAINEELYESNKRQTKQEGEMLRVRDEMMKKIDLVMKLLEREVSKQISTSQEKQEVESLETTFFTP